MESSLINLRDVVFGFTEGATTHPVLRGVSGSIRRGEWVALLGQSGSGKSTLLHLIAGLDLPSAGSIEIAGMAVSDLDERARTLFRRRHIGFVYQAFNLLPTLTAIENVALVAELNGRRPADARERAVALLGEVGLGFALERYPDRLSGGEQQRVAIARALAHDPWLLLADEPTGNLDAGNGDRVLDLLDTMLRKRGHTLLIATHSPDVAARADRIWHLRDGYLQMQ